METKFDNNIYDLLCATLNCDVADYLKLLEIANNFDIDIYQIVKKSMSHRINEMIRTAYDMAIASAIDELNGKVNNQKVNRILITTNAMLSALHYIKEEKYEHVCIENKEELCDYIKK